jgi:hypothetical protein
MQTRVQTGAAIDANVCADSRVDWYKRVCRLSCRLAQTCVQTLVSTGTNVCADSRVDWHKRVCTYEEPEAPEWRTFTPVSFEKMTEINVWSLYEVVCSQTPRNTSQFYGVPRAFGLYARSSRIRTVRTFLAHSDCTHVPRAFGA